MKIFFCCGKKVCQEEENKGFSLKNEIFDGEF